MFTCVGCGKKCRGSNWDFYGNYAAHNEHKDVALSMTDEDQANGLRNEEMADIIRFPEPVRKAA